MERSVDVLVEDDRRRLYEVLFFFHLTHTALKFAFIVKGGSALPLRQVEDFVYTRYVLTTLTRRLYKYSQTLSLQQDFLAICLFSVYYCNVRLLKVLLPTYL